MAAKKKKAKKKKSTPSVKSKDRKTNLGVGDHNPGQRK